MLPARDMPLRTGDPDAAPERLHAWDSQTVLKREFSALEAAFDPRRSRGGREQPLTLRVAPPGQPTDLQAVDNDIPQNEVPTGAVGAGSIAPRAAKAAAAKRKAAAAAAKAGKAGGKGKAEQG